MTATLTGSIKIALAATLTNALDLVTASAPLSSITSYAITSGTGANQSNMIFSDTRATDATGESLDLAGGLTDALGVTITFTAIKGIVVKAASANTLDVVVGGAAANQFVNWVGDATDKIVVKPGGIFVLYDPGATGYAVTAGTGDLLKIAASATGSVTYDIILVGEV